MERLRLIPRNEQNLRAQRLDALSGKDARAQVLGSARWNCGGEEVRKRVVGDGGEEGVDSGADGGFVGGGGWGGHCDGWVRTVGLEGGFWCSDYSL
jgi:hypothetical protein